MDAPTLLKRVAPFQSYINRFPLEYGNIFLEVFSDVEVIFTVIIIMILAKLVDRIYKRIDLEHYSPIWEYFAKALLYGMITVFTMFYGKDSLNDVTPLEWAIISVSFLELCCFWKEKYRCLYYSILN
jgi:hypothetical protein